MIPPARRACLLLLVCALGGCVQLHPLGDDWEDLSPPERRARAAQTLHDAFAWRVDPAGQRRPDLEVVDCSPTSITYRAGVASSHLAWADVRSVTHRSLDDLPGRPEDLALILEPESPSAAEVVGLEAGLSAELGLGGPKLWLRQRPRHTHNRVVLALDYLQTHASGPEPAPTAAPAAPTPTPETPPAPTPAEPDRAPEAIEARLRQLKAWHEEGLITEEEYEDKRREVLDRL